jgi:hypothetical protein
MTIRLSPADQTELRHLLKVTLHRLASATVNHSDACGCGLCQNRREAAKRLEEMESEPDVYKVLVEKIGRKSSGIGGGV